MMHSGRLDDKSRLSRFSSGHRPGRHRLPSDPKHIRRNVIAVLISALIVLALAVAVVLVDTAGPSIPDSPPVIYNTPSTVQSTVK